MYSCVVAASKWLANREKKSCLLGVRMNLTKQVSKRGSKPKPASLHPGACWRLSVSCTGLRESLRVCGRGGDDGAVDPVVSLTWSCKWFSCWKNKMPEAPPFRKARLLAYVRGQL